MVLGNNTSGHIFDTTFTTEGVLYSAASGVITSTASGSTGQIFQSAGNASPPVYSTSTYPSTATGTGKVLIADGTNWVASTPTFPNSSATSGKIIQSDGTNWLASTPTFPTTAGTSGKILISDGTNIISSTPTYPNSASATGTILRADGTNWVATTATYPATTTVNRILYSSSTSVVGEITTANSGVLATSSSGVPSIDTTNFAVLSTGLQLKGNNTNTAPPAGFIGEQLTANATSVSLSNNTAKTITSVVLTPGVWDISGSVFFFNSGVTTSISAGISTTNNTMPAGNAGINLQTVTPPAGTTTSLVMGFSVPLLRALVSTNTTYYLVGLTLFSGGTSTENGYITATRVG